MSKTKTSNATTAAWDQELGGNQDQRSGRIEHSNTDVGRFSMPVPGGSEDRETHGKSSAPMHVTRWMGYGWVPRILDAGRQGFARAAIASHKGKLSLAHGTGPPVHGTQRR